MFRLVHIADVHLDSAFAGRSDNVRVRLRDSIRRAFKNAVDLAITERVDAFVIAGDLFDGENVSFVTEKLLLDQAVRLREAGIRGFYASGNHDPSSRFGGTTPLEWPDNFHVFSTEEPDGILVKNENGDSLAHVVGAGHSCSEEAANLAVRFPVAAGAVPHVGVLHTMVTGVASSDGHHRYAPSTVEDLRRPGYDYWALGHIHVRQPVDEIANAWYPGNLQGRNPKESGSKGALLVSVSKGRPASVQFRPLAPIQWAHLILDDLGKTASIAQLEVAAARTFESSRAAGISSEHIVVIDLVGECPLESDLQSAEQISDLEELLADHLGVLAVEVRTGKLVRPLQLDQYVDEPHVVGEVLDLIRRAKSDSSLLRDLAPEILANREGTTSPDEYLASLLVDLEFEAAGRMIKRS